MSILPPSPFVSVSPGDGRGSLPSGESEPSVTLAYAPGESASSTSTGGAPEAPLAGPPNTRPVSGLLDDDHRFVLDEEAFMLAIEPMPLFLQAPIEALRMLARH